MSQINEVPDFIIFIGRFHPLLVHLPIGILIIGIILHFCSKSKKYKHTQKSIPLILGFGALSAIISSILGYLLSFQGGYNKEALSDHQWMGICVTLTSILAYFISVWKKTKKKRIINSILMIMIFIGLSFTGHLGGNLTHGSSYLTQFAPDPIRKVMGLSPKPEERPIVKVLDSADVFLDVIQPMISNKCASCHNTEKSKGDLLLLSYEDMMKGGKSGSAIVAGNLQKSELFKRITLPQNHKEFMPPEGKEPLSDNDVKLIEFWINKGAKSEGILANFELEEKETKFFESYLNLEAKDNSILDTKVEKGDSLVIKLLIDRGFKIKTISNSSNFLDVKFSSKQIIDEKVFSDLLKLKNQIVYLDLSKTNLTDKDLKKIGQLEFLVRLQIHSNPITNLGISYLTKLQNLESLNIYNTLVDEESIKIVSKLKNLKRVYFWKTKIKEKNLNLIEKRQDLHIIL